MKYNEKILIPGNTGMRNYLFNISTGKNRRAAVLIHTDPLAVFNKLLHFPVFHGVHTIY